MDMSVVCKVSLLLMFMASMLLSTTASHRHCRDPDNFEQLKAQHIHQNPNHESVLNIPPHAIRPRHLKDIQRIAPAYVNIILSYEYGRTDCPPRPDQYPGQNNATCPWYFVQNTDENRYPQVIFHAVCSCLHCLDFLHNTQTTNTCKPVPNYIRVLRRTGCSHNQYIYETALEPMPTGCTCTAIKPMISRSQDSRIPTL